MLAASLQSHSLRSNKGISLSVPRVKTNTDTGASTLVPYLFRITSHCLSVQPFQLLPSLTSADTSLWLGLSPIDTSMPNGQLMWWNSFLNFAVEHWFSSCATEPVLAGNIGVIEICLSDWHSIVEMTFIYVIRLCTVGWVSLVARALDWHAEKVGSYPGLCLQARHFFLLFFICGQRCKWQSCQLKLTSSVISDIKSIIFFSSLFTFSLVW